MPNLYPIARPVFRLLQPEAARDWTVRCLEAGLGSLMVSRSAKQPDSSVLAQRIWNLDFKNPIGLAAGFDKDARVPDQLVSDWHFGFVEVGTVTPRPQSGNLKPRVFRLTDDAAIINRMGFNNCGLPEVLERLRARTRGDEIVGLNLGKNKDTEDAASDYEEGIFSAANLVDYLVVNISSPNTPGLRDLQRRAPFEQLLTRLIAARNQVNPGVPLLVKVAPDLSAEDCQDIAAVALECGIDGIIVSNTTIDFPSTLKSVAATQEGGLSGKPLFQKSTKILAQIYSLTKGRIPLVGVGGVSTAEQAFEKICAGASLVQLYSALVFDGPMLVSHIKWGLDKLLKTNGYSSVAAAVGSRSEIWARSQPMDKEPQTSSRQYAGIMSPAKRAMLSPESASLSSL